MSGETQFYLVAIPAVILFGLSKGGFSGLSSLAMPMMSLVASPARAAAIVLPILIVQDWVSEDAVRLAIGVISIAFVAYMLIRDRLGRAPVEKPGVPSGVPWGSLSGFTSFVSHAGAPPFQVCVMPQYLEPRIFAGTATIFFAAVNILKLPGYFLLGQLSFPTTSVCRPGCYRWRFYRPLPASGWSGGRPPTGSIRLFSHLPSLSE